MKETTDYVPDYLMLLFAGLILAMICFVLIDIRDYLIILAEAQSRCVPPVPQEVSP